MRGRGKVHLALDVQLAVDVLGALPATAIVKPACQPTYWVSGAVWHCSPDPAAVDCWHCRRVLAARSQGGGA